MTPIDPDSQAASRRRFFTAGLRSLLGAAEEAARTARGWLPGATPSPGKHSDRGPTLRPPGALPEAVFQETCERSGRCVAACPVQALQPLRSADPDQEGTPCLIPSQRACVVCDDLACMKACPSGALTLVPKTAIRIGLAVMDFDTCRRTAGEPCRECIERCPIGTSAIGLDDRGRVEVRAAGCVGCGVCELYCPTRPRAIVIVPLAPAV